MVLFLSLPIIHHTTQTQISSSLPNKSNTQYVGAVEILLAFLFQRVASSLVLPGDASIRLCVPAHLCFQHVEVPPDDEDADDFVPVSKDDVLLHEVKSADSLSELIEPSPSPPASAAPPVASSADLADFVPVSKDDVPLHEVESADSLSELIGSSPSPPVSAVIPVAGADLADFVPVSKDDVSLHEVESADSLSELIESFPSSVAVRVAGDLVSSVAPEPAAAADDNHVAITVQPELRMDDALDNWGSGVPLTCSFESV